MDDWVSFPTFNSVLNVGHLRVDLIQVFGRLVSRLLGADELVGQVNLGEVFQLALNLLELEVGRLLGPQLLHGRRDLVIEQLEERKR